MRLREIRAALSGAMIETRYQPVVRIADGRPVALEVLARLNHPARGTLLPDLFVPQMEDAGLAPLLTETVARLAFADMAGPSLAPHGLDLALNFPLDVLLVPEALELLDIQRRHAGIAAARVIIELTESRPVEDLVTLRGAMKTLRIRSIKTSLVFVVVISPLSASFLWTRIRSRIGRRIIPHQWKSGAGGGTSDSGFPAVRQCFSRLVAWRPGGSRFRWPTIRRKP